MNDRGSLLIDFNDQDSLRAYNQAIMEFHFGIKNFITPKDSMAPCLGNRINYLDWLGDLIMAQKYQVDTIVDVGTGSSAIYLLLAYQKFKWKGIGLEINEEAIQNARQIIKANKLQKEIKIK